MVEGLLPAPALEKVKNEFQHDGYDMLIITGLNFPGNYYEVSMDGYLIFTPILYLPEIRQMTFILLKQMPSVNWREE